MNEKLDNVLTEFFVADKIPSLELKNSIQIKMQQIQLKKKLKEVYVLVISNILYSVLVYLILGFFISSIISMYIILGYLIFSEIGILLIAGLSKKELLLKEVV